MPRDCRQGHVMGQLSIICPFVGQLTEPGPVYHESRILDNIFFKSGFNKKAQQSLTYPRDAV